MKKLTAKQYKKGYEVALAALKTLATNTPDINLAWTGGTPTPAYKVYAEHVVKNLEDGTFLK